MSSSFEIAEAFITFKLRGFDEAQGAVDGLGKGLGKLGAINDAIVPPAQRLTEQTRALTSAQEDATDSSEGFSDAFGGLGEASEGILESMERIAIELEDTDWYQWAAGIFGAIGAVKSITDILTNGRLATSIANLRTAMTGGAPMAAFAPLKPGALDGASGGAVAGLAAGSATSGLAGGSGAAAAGGGALTGALAGLAAALGIALVLLAVFKAIGMVMELLFGGISEAGEKSKPWADAMKLIGKSFDAIKTAIGTQWAATLEPIVVVFAKAFDIASRFVSRITELAFRFTGIKDLVMHIVSWIDLLLTGIEKGLELMGLLTPKLKEAEKKKEDEAHASFVGLEEYSKTLQGQVEKQAAIDEAKKANEKLDRLIDNTNPLKNLNTNDRVRQSFGLA